MALKKAEIEHFKERLLQMRQKLTGSLRESSQEAKQTDKSTGYSQHQADQGTDDFDRTVSLELSNQELGLLKQIDRALQKVEENTYGVCDVTQEEIPIKRLEAIPYAVMTVKAQEMVEKGLI